METRFDEIRVELRLFAKDEWRMVRRVETSLGPSSSRISRIEARLTELDLWTIILQVLTSLLSFLRGRTESEHVSLYLSLN